MQQGALPESLSTKFSWWVFTSIALIVFLHGYDLQQRFLQPWTTVQEKLTATAFAEYFIANGLLRFLIPMLFAISGFLYASRDSVPNLTRMRRRARTLLLPYLLWSSFALAMTYVMELFPYTRNLVFTSGIAYLDDKRRLLHDYRWYELLRSWLLSTIAYQLWFIRVLLIYNLIYPALRWCMLHRSRNGHFGWQQQSCGSGNFESPLVERRRLVLLFSRHLPAKNRFPSRDHARETAKRPRLGLPFRRIGDGKDLACFSRAGPVGRTGIPGNAGDSQIDGGQRSANGLVWPGWAGALDPAP